MTEELRAYFFNNMYLTGIHAGIQAQHCTTEMFTKYIKGTHLKQALLLFEWAKHHKTTIILNGGHASNLWEIANILNHLDNPYPWAIFQESYESLSGCITSVGIILPEKVFGLDERQSSILKKNSQGLGYVPPEQCYKNMTDFDKRLGEKVGSCGPAFLVNIQ